jgi:hypothetical protein
MLANLYMNRFLKHWRQIGRGEVSRAHVISYADDFDPQPPIGGRGNGVDKGSNGQARADAQRGENQVEERPYVATLVDGTFTFERGERAGALPGRLVRADGNRRTLHGR